MAQAWNILQVHRHCILPDLHFFCNLFWNSSTLSCLAFNALLFWQLCAALILVLALLASQSINYSFQVSSPLSYLMSQWEFLFIFKNLNFMYLPWQCKVTCNKTERKILPSLSSSRITAVLCLVQNNLQERRKLLSSWITTQGHIKLLDQVFQCSQLPKFTKMDLYYSCFLYD